MSEIPHATPRVCVPARGGVKVNHPYYNIRNTDRRANLASARMFAPLLCSRGSLFVAAGSISRKAVCRSVQIKTSNYARHSQTHTDTRTEAEIVALHF